MQKVSVYIPCYNAAEYLARVIDGVLAQTHAADEVLLVDDGSRDESLAIAARYPQVRVIRHERNRGLSAARNSAFAAARNEWVAALDSDCVAQPRWLETLAARAGRGDVAGVGGRLVETVIQSIADRWRATHLNQDWGTTPLLNPPFLFGNNSLLHRRTVMDLGGYAERLRTNGEDADLSQRLRTQGLTFAYEPDAVVHHLRRDTVLSVLNMHWRYRQGHEKPVHFANLWSNWRYLHFGRARAALQKDLCARRVGLAAFDLMLFVFPVWRDLREASNNHAVAIHRETRTT